MSDEIQHPKKAKFLKCYASTCSITKAAELAGIDRSTHYEWLKTDPEYPERFSKAQDLAGGTLEDVAHEMAVLERNPTMLIFMLKGRFPQKYRENVHQQIDMKVDMALEQRLIEARNRTRPKGDAV